MYDDNESSTTMKIALVNKFTAELVKAQRTN